MLWFNRAIFAYSDRLLGEIVAIAGYALLFAAVYKLFQIGTDIGEIKTLLQVRGIPVSAQATPLAPGDPATEYAQTLLRAVNAESRHSETQPR